MPEIGGVGLLTALFAGMVSFFSPCVLPLVPGYLSAVTGISPSELDRASWRAVIPPSLVFIASFSTIFILLGLTAVGLTQTLRQNQDTLDKVAGVLIIVMGVLFVAQLFVLKLNREWRIEALIERAGSGGPLIAGAAFAIAWTPCIGPTLAAILALAGSTGSVLQGGLMLAVYSLGLAIPFLLTAIAFARMTTAFGFIKRHYAAIMAAGGVVLIVMGVLVFTGELTRLNLEAQQALDDMGINFFNEV
jgi:cytochrome c-type biogenesis protein